MEKTMKNRIFLFGMFSILLTFSLALVGCKDDSSGDNGGGGPSITISGTPKVGEKLTATLAGFSGTVYVDWQVAASSSATKNEWTNLVYKRPASEGYTLTTTSVGRYIRVQAYNDDYSKEAVSTVIGPITN